ncbi:MAG: hypothetical protein ACLU9S_21325 [Oscillospiraceae bacterium]
MPSPFITTLLIVFADPLCRFFFQSAEAGNLLRIMAPIVPLMYVDSVVDGMLKGWISSCLPSAAILRIPLLRVAAVAVLLPLWGMAGYAAVLFFSEIFNASLSIYRLLRVTELGARPCYLGASARGRSRSALLSARSASLCRVARRAAHLPPAASVRFLPVIRVLACPSPRMAVLSGGPDGFLLFDSERCGGCA